VNQLVFLPATKSSGSTWAVQFSPKDPDYGVLVDGSNNIMSVFDRKTGKVTQTIGRSGRNAGDFHWVHALAIDSSGDLYTGEVDTGKRVQKFKRIAP
jgi:WD40 repeat protein